MFPLVTPGDRHFVMVCFAVHLLYFIFLGGPCDLFSSRRFPYFFFGEFPLFYCPSSLDFKNCSFCIFTEHPNSGFYCALFRTRRWEVLNDVGARGTRSLWGHTGLPLPQACSSQMPLGPCAGSVLPRWLSVASCSAHSWDFASLLASHLGPRP